MSSDNENIQVKSIRVVDDDGNIRAFLGSMQRVESRYEPCLVMYDNQGFPRIEVGMRSNDPFVLLSLADGNPSISIGQLHEEVKGILINDSKGSPCIMIQVQSNGDSRVIFYQSDNNSINIIKSYPEQ